MNDANLPTGDLAVLDGQLAQAHLSLAGLLYDDDETAFRAAITAVYCLPLERASQWWVIAGPHAGYPNGASVHVIVGGAHSDCAAYWDRQVHLKG